MEQQRTEAEKLSSVMKDAYRGEYAKQRACEVILS